MKSRSKFVPVGVRIETSKQLELSMHDQKSLITDMKLTMNELEEHPLAIPKFTSAILGRIPLLNSAGERKGRDQLWLHYSETDEGQRNAKIDFTEDGHLNRLILSQTTNAWDLYRDGSDTPVNDLSSEGVVNLLSRKVRQPETFDTLLDIVNFDPMAVPHMLAAHLEKSARRRERRVTYMSRYITANSQTPDTDTDVSYVASNITDLSVFSVNGRTIHSLRTGAPFEVGKTIITKEYAYSAETSDTDFFGSQGLVKVGSKDGYEQSALEPYARFDQNVNDPLFSLYRGLGMLRVHHGLVDTEDAA